MLRINCMHYVANVSVYFLAPYMPSSGDGSHHSAVCQKLQFHTCITVNRESKRIKFCKYYQVVGCAAAVLHDLSYRPGFIMHYKYRSLCHGNCIVMSFEVKLTNHISKNSFFASLSPYALIQTFVMSALRHSR